MEGPNATRPGARVTFRRFIAAAASRPRSPRREAKAAPDLNPSRARRLLSSNPRVAMGREDDVGLLIALAPFALADIAAVVAIAQGRARASRRAAADG